MLSMSFVVRLCAAFFLFVVSYPDFPTRGNGNTSVANENVFPVRREKDGTFSQSFLQDTTREFKK